MAEPTVAEIEARINMLYQMGNPQVIKETDAFLTTLQRSERGWEIADALMHSEDDKVQYYGALTFTVKLNQDGDKLDENQSSLLLSTLMSWLLRLEKTSQSKVVATKFCSTLANYFCKPTSSWTKCLHTLACSFYKGTQVPEESIDKFLSIWELLPALTDGQIYYLLLFAMDLAETAKNSSQQQHEALHKRMASNTVDIEALLHEALRRGQEVVCMRDEIAREGMQEAGQKILTQALKTYVSWVFYAQQEFKNSTESLKNLRTVFDMAVPCLELDVDDAMDIFADILDNYPKFLLPEQQRKLWECCMSPWGIEILNQNDDTSVTLLRMVIAYCQILLNSGRLYKEAGQDIICDQALGTLHNLLKYEGYVGESDEIAPPVADFWSVYISTLDDEMFKIKATDVKPAWVDIAKAHTFLVVTELFHKIRIPPPEVTKEWDSESRSRFKSFRMDVRDLFQSAYEQIREPLLDHFVKVIQSALAEKAWLQVEAGLFCLNSIAEELDADTDLQIRTLLGTSLFDHMTAAEDIPAATRRSAVEMVSHFTEFFLRNMDFVAPVLRFLVTALAQPALANSAAKSFASLCSSCRKALTGELGSFFDMYQQFLGYQTAEVHTKGKVMEGIAAIIEALPSDAEKATRLQQLFQYISMDAQNAITPEHAGTETGAVFALAALQCLTSIGKALQAQDDAVIDLESEGLSGKGSSSFWTEGPGSVLQSQIFQFIQVLTQIHGKEGDIIEEACSIFRTGYKESVPGPFLLPPKATVDFVASTDVNTPRLPFVLDTACIFVRSHKCDKSLSFHEQAQLLLRYVLKLMQQLGHPSTDPEVSVGCIEVVQRIINTNADILNGESSEILQAMFQFSIECVLSPDVLPKRAAAELWNDIFALALDMRHPQQSIAQQIVSHFGRPVTRALVFNVCGEADTSSLDYIMPPLRKMIQSQPWARTEITEALSKLPLFARAPEHFEVQKIMRMFTEGLMRNARQFSAFKVTVKDFSQKCRKMAVQLGPDAPYLGISPNAPQ
ncbi:ARM repeat-containing protein [Lophium mytilinum]|uniref:ARM repeat-containing protein n=1 Tax=Lophium mytilinum TaxID=390894 RepID=A0A6A6QFY2_9PEZI|nr:ARM repeat-containing protein [Lophium mytilinum]